MEDTAETTGSPSLSDFNQLRHRYSLPDVPEDVEDDMLHFNDPNWDFNANSSTLSISTDGVEHKRWSKSSTYMGPSSEVDTELQDSKAEFSSEGTQVQDSPYPEVRAAVANTDDPTMVVNTFRVWFLGLLLAMIVPAFNAVISLRFPYVIISVLFVQIVTLPLGKFMEWALPRYRISAFGHSFSLNPGPFNIKEHTLIAVMVNVVIDGTTITDISATARIIFDDHWSIGKQFFLGLVLHLLGFSFAGALRQFLVWPSSMIWPGVLVRCALLNAMHSNFGKNDKKHISRERFLYLACICSFVWYWVPGYLWTGLSVFNWVCWIAPNNVIINNLFGTVNGLGMGLLTFDWAQISVVGSPLVIPWWAQLNMFGGFVFVVWFICPILWAKNAFYSQYIPISAGESFDNTGNPYNLSAVVTNNLFDQKKYEQYSPLFLPITYAISYGTIFATYPAILVHTFLWYRHDVVRQFRHSLEDETDIHAYLMRKYPEVPRWWFIALGTICITLGIISVEICKTGLPVWAFFFSVFFAMIFVIPFGIIQAITNQQFFLSALSEITIGYILPGRPIAAMLFKTISSDTVSQAMSYSSDLKFGYYLKVPPRLIFIGQVLSSMVALLSQIVAQQWALTHIPDICSPEQKNSFVCPNLKLFFTSSIIWGGIGPKRLFSPGTIYYPMLWFFLIGAILPIPAFYLARRRPRSVLALRQYPRCIWFMRRFHFRWWMRYNYLLSTGLDAGVIFGLIIIFFSVQLPKGGFNLNWWGNDVWKNTADANMIPWKTLAPNTTFGPTTWS
ncbi:OPT-domain-containing protein [Russula ochroleuca]|uniref:OPT-domain-containing protein n=1 Tax=Russula ochroleuca TaxID=152965 RepID=A0A9P5TAQ2_9AGAM|nr:OPT-domain-containing protein [Russula ochroleuca]